MLRGTFSPDITELGWLLSEVVVTSQEELQLTLQSGLVIEEISHPISHHCQAGKQDNNNTRQPGLAWRAHVMVDQHVGQTAQHDDHHHQHHDQPQHGEGDHLEDAVVLRVAVLGQDGHLKYGKIKTR